SYPSCHLNSVQMSRVLSFKSLCNKAITVLQKHYLIDTTQVADGFPGYQISTRVLCCINAIPQ
ncbi:hypothetical protein KR627_04500, partial [Acinetobacter baumannii]|nr:hypothetical protein [Acinetobacter baumannii]MCE6138945.1 hypothetical protein [Acinetobacter baumannii]